MKKIILLSHLLPFFYLSVLQYGCVILEGPKDNSGFNNITSLSDLEGIYKNLGEGEKSSSTIYLSSIIWPKLVSLDHQSIETIEVKLIERNALLVRAVGKTEIIYESTFVEGTDFDFDSGYIMLRQVLGLSLGYPAGNPFIGIIYEKRTLGLDQRGEGKFRMSGAVAGVAFLVLPMIGTGRTDVRFLRITE